MSDNIINEATKCINMLRGSWDQNFIFGINPQSTDANKEKHYQIVYKATTLIVLLENAIHNIQTYSKVGNQAYQNIWIANCKELISDANAFYVLSKIKMKPRKAGRK